ncbi:MAG TPA: hypothetical protein VFM23_07730 [Gemmatimonadales bacterium]|nr:hypothetical protein [Gemmatimonadales bacterium]
MVKQLIPEYFTEREVAAVEKRHDTLELVVLDIVESSHSLLMHPSITGSELPDLSWTPEVRGLILETEAAYGDAERQARIDLAEVPREFPDRAPLGIGAEVVLIDWQRLEEADDILCFGVPGRAKSVDIVAFSHGPSFLVDRATPINEMRLSCRAVWRMSKTDGFHTRTAPPASSAR